MKVEIWEGEGGGESHKGVRGGGESHDGGDMGG